jgi:hypothetical protein
MRALARPAPPSPLHPMDFENIQEGAGLLGQRGGRVPMCVHVCAYIGYGRVVGR